MDITTAWIELEPVWGKGQDRVGGAVDHVRTRLPMPLLGLDSDNGSEFMNYALLEYCRRHRVTFTRSRPWKKNDSAHVEQKNGAVVRQLVGYDRFASRAAYGALTRLYRLARLHVNFFQPVEKPSPRPVRGRGATASTTARKPPTSACPPPADCRPTPIATWRRSTSRSTRSSSSARSSARWSSSGPWRPPTRAGSGELPESPPPSGRRLPEEPRPMARVTLSFELTRPGG